MDFCESCVYGKQKRVSFVEIGKEKKNEKGKKLKCLRSNYRGEYCSKAF